MPMDFSDDRIFTPEETQRMAQREQKLRAAESRFTSLRKLSEGRVAELSHPSVLPGARFSPGINDEPGFLNVAKDLGVGVLDLLQRGNFAAAGLADELFVKGTGPIQALGRVFKELASGIGSIQGEKDTFRDVLDGVNWFSEKTLGDSIDAVDGIPIASGFNLRGGIGLTLDIFLDPLTYLSGGGSALAKVPKAFRGVKLAGKSRLVGTVDDATKAFTKRGARKRLVERKAALKEIVADPKATRGLIDEADRLVIEEVQDELMLNLMQEGIRPKRAAQVVTDVVGKLAATRYGGVDAIADIQKTIRRMNPNTARKVKQALGMDTKIHRQRIGEVLAKEVRDRGDDMLRTGIEGADGPLRQLAEDIAMKRATDSVLALVKNGEKNLLRDISPLRMEIPFSDIGFNIGPAGKSLTEWVVQSGMSGKMIGALKQVMPKGVANAGIEASAKLRKGYEAIGRSLNQAWDANKLRGFHVLRRATLDATGATVAKNLHNLSQTKVASWYDGVLKATKKNRKLRNDTFRAFAIALDTGDLGKLAPDAVEAALEFKAIMRKTVATDVRRGLMKPGLVRKNYFPHFIDHPDEIIKSMIQQRPGRNVVQQASIGRFAEARGFQTIPDIEAAALKVGVDPKINFDPMVALRQRTQASIEGTLYDDFYNSVAQEFGRDALPFDAQAFYDLAKPLTDPNGVGQLIAENLSRTSPSLKTLAMVREKYGAGAVGEFLRQKLLNARNGAHAVRIVNKYADFTEALPRMVTKDLAPDGSRYVDAPAMFKGMKNRQIPESALKVIEGMRVQAARNPSVDEFLGHFDNATNRVKVFLTALFPAFHFRNAYSNVAQGMLDMGLAALNPYIHIRAAKLAALTTSDTGRVLSKVPRKMLVKENLEALAWKELDGTVVTMGEAKREILRNRIVRHREEIFEKAQIKGRPQAGASPVVGMTDARKLFNYWERAGTSAGGFIENEGRIAIYTQLRSKGLTELEATERVNKLLFDYDALTEVERVYLKRAIPFYVWTKKNIALQAQAIRNMPGRVVNMTKPFNNEDAEVTGAMLEYQTGNFRMQLDRDGKSVRMLTGIDLPIMSLDRILPVGKVIRGDFGEAFKHVATNMTPFLRVPAELMANEEFFSGKELDRTTSTSIGKLLDPEGPSGKVIPDAVRRWLGYNRTTFPGGKHKYDFDGQKFHLLFKSYITSRMLTSSDAWFRRASMDQGLAQNFLAVMTSLQIKDMNLTEMQTKKLNERSRLLEKRLVEQGLKKKKNTTFEIKDSPQYRQQR